MDVLKCIGMIVLLPIFLAGFSIFMLLWLVWTLSGIGPLTHWYFSNGDKETLDRLALARKHSNMHVITVPGDVHSCSMGEPYKLFAIFSQPSTPSKYPPVCVPNGLGASAVLISKMQESLVSAGFAVLSFDRFGVGLSDENTSNTPPTASDVVREMDFVMNHFMTSISGSINSKSSGDTNANSIATADTSTPSGNTKWILLGPSKGSIVAQCYIAAHPDKVVGFLNMDGLPYPFIQQRGLFAWAGFVYKIYASIIWTGILRPFIHMSKKDIERMFGSELFPVEVGIAQINQRRFFANVALEMHTMMDCCAMAERAWGAQSLLRLPADDIKVIT